MTIHCSWCNNEMSPNESGRSTDRRISLPLCSSCSELLVFQMGVPLQTFIDRLPAPIFVVDNNATVEAANALGYSFLNKKPEDVIKKLGGVVFECAYSRLPEGCGGTVHCSGCAIRRSVYHTFETGESQIEVPATLKYDGPGKSGDINMLISTEKMGEVVLLRIDKVCTPAGAC
ncbi:MAG: hypothetical protein OEW15_01215 [Nitrospirota bacterium]|nr:hypothetical protein [Nitrospirota bacterium]